MEGHLWQIIQKHLDDYGVREAEFARRIGTSPQTVSSWKKRGIRSLPDKHLLVGVSNVTRRPYDEVLTAVLHDIKYLPKDADDGTATNQAGVSPAPTQLHADLIFPRNPPIEVVSDQALPSAALQGPASVGRGRRRAQDEQGEAPDVEGPEGGA